MAQAMTDGVAGTSLASMSELYDAAVDQSLSGVVKGERLTAGKACAHFDQAAQCAGRAQARHERHVALEVEGRTRDRQCANRVSSARPGGRRSLPARHTSGGIQRRYSRFILRTCEQASSEVVSGNSVV